MRRSLLRVTPEEFAGLAKDLGPDGAATVTAERRRRMSRTAASVRAALAELLADEDSQPRLPAAR